MVHAILKEALEVDRMAIDWEAYDKELGEDKLRELAEKAYWFELVISCYGSLD